MSCCPPDGFDEDEDRNHVDRPVHSRKFAQFSDEWYRACNQAFGQTWKRFYEDREQPGVWVLRPEREPVSAIASFIESTLARHGSKQIEAS